MLVGHEALQNFRSVAEKFQIREGIACPTVKQFSLEELHRVARSAYCLQGAYTIITEAQSKHLLFWVFSHSGRYGNREASRPVTYEHANW